MSKSSYPRSRHNPSLNKPSPLSKAFGDDSSGDERAGTEDEIITGFDKFGVTRINGRKKEGPLIIPALKNKDWREVAKARNAPSFVPHGGAAATGADGTVGGLGTRDTINSGPRVSGLVLKKRVAVETEIVEETMKVEPQPANEEPQPELTDDQKAIDALLKASTRNPDDLSEDQIAAIPLPASGASTPSLAEREQAAYHRDIAVLPDSATLDDYDRIPVSQFGAALLRGMGWKEGTAASRTRKGIVEPWLPAQRPALLGIGAKEREVLDDGSGKDGKRKKAKQDSKKYSPLVKIERDHSGSSSRNGSRRTSRERSPEHKRRRDQDYRSQRRSREREYDSDRDRAVDRRRDRERAHDSDKEYDKERNRRREREDSGRLDRDRDRERRK